MNQDPVKVQLIQWTSVLPLLNLTKALKFAYRARTLVPSLLAVVLLSFLVTAFAAVNPPNQTSPLSHILQEHNPIQLVVASSWQLLNHNGANGSSLLLSCLLFHLISLAAGIGISRAACSEFCAEERSGAFRNLKLTGRRTFAATKISIAFLVFGGIAFLPVLAVRLLLLFVTGAVSLWPVLSLAAIPVIVVWLLLIVCGPFVAAAIATDDCEPADAVSRSINYVLSHKLKVVGIVCVSLVLATLSSMLCERLIFQSMLLVSGDLPGAIPSLEGFTVYADQSQPQRSSGMPQLISAAVEFAVLQSALAIGYILLRRQEDSIPYRELKQDI